MYLFIDFNALLSKCISLQLDLILTMTFHKMLKSYAATWINTHSWYMPISWLTDETWFFWTLTTRMLTFMCASFLKMWRNSIELTKRFLIAMPLYSRNSWKLNLTHSNIQIRVDKRHQISSDTFKTTTSTNNNYNVWLYLFSKYNSSLFIWWKEHG